MKKVILLFAAVISLSFANATGGNEEVKYANATEAPVVNSFKLINDTKRQVSIHTGTGFVTLNKGGSTSVGCNIGKEVRFAESGKKGDLIFKIESSMCGQTIKLSSYVK